NPGGAANRGLQYVSTCVSVPGHHFRSSVGVLLYLDLPPKRVSPRAPHGSRLTELLSTIERIWPLLGLVPCRAGAPKQGHDLLGTGLDPAAAVALRKIDRCLADVVHDVHLGAVIEQVRHD